MSEMFESERTVETPRRLRSIQAQQRSEGPSYGPQTISAQDAASITTGVAELMGAVDDPSRFGVDPRFPAGQPRPSEAAYSMPVPILPFVRFRFSESDEAAYAVVLRRGPRTLDLGVFAANHGRMQQMNGCRHGTDPELDRLREFVPGIWEELPQMTTLINFIDQMNRRMAGLESVVADLTRPGDGHAEDPEDAEDSRPRRKRRHKPDEPAPAEATPVAVSAPAHAGDEEPPADPGFE